MSERCVLTLPLKTEKWQEDIINKRLELQRQVYNAMLGFKLKQLEKLKQNPEYIEAMNSLREYAQNDKKGCKEYKEAGKKRNTLLREYGFSEFDFVSNSLKFAKYFSENIGSKVAAYSIGKPMWQAFDKMLFGIGDMVHFKCKDSVNSVVSDGKSAIKIIDEKNIRIDQYTNEEKIFVEYGTRGNKILKLPIKFNLDNTYELDMLSLPIKQVRILRKKEKCKYKYYVQLCLEGKPAIKFDKETGEIKHPIGSGKVGIFVNTNSVTVTTKDGTKKYLLSKGVDDYTEEIANLQQYLENSRRATNPDNFNPDGTIKKGIMINGERCKLKWHFSNRYIKARNQLAELQRLERVKRKLHHQILANEIFALGNDFRFNVYPFAEVAKKSTEDKLTKKGTPASKKRAGKSIGDNAPSMFIEILKNKINNYDNGIFIDCDLSKEENFYKTNNKTEQWSNFMFNL